MQIGNICTYGTKAHTNHLFVTYRYKDTRLGPSLT